MTELTPEVLESTGRNDPCPCGSGKKFKKCHQRTLRITKEAEKKTRGVEQLVGPNTIAYQMFKLLRQIRENNMLNLFWELSHELGPFRARYPELVSYLEAAELGGEKLPAGKYYDLRRIRVDGPDVHLLLTQGHRDPKTTTVSFEVVTLRPNEIDSARGARDVAYRGWRVWDLERHERNKSELEDFDLSLEDLGYTWQDAWTAPESLQAPAPAEMESTEEA